MGLVANRPEAGTTERKERYYDPRDLRSLLRQLEDPDPAERRWAARDLGEHAEAAEALCARFPHEEDNLVREAILDSLLRIGGDGVVRGLLPLLRSDDAAVRNGAVEALQEMPDDVAPYMTKTLADDDPDVRIFAADILQLLPHPEAPGWLAEALARETHVNVAGTIIDRLAEIGDEAAIPAIEAAKERFADEPYIAFAADTAISRIREA